MNWPDAFVAAVVTLSVSWVVLRLVQVKRYEPEWSEILDTAVWNTKARLYRARRVLRFLFLPWWEMALRQKKWEREKRLTEDARIEAWTMLMKQFQADKEKIVSLLEERREP